MAVRPSESDRDSSTVLVEPVKMAPASKRRAVRTSRLRLCASIVTIPGSSDGRRSAASSLSGFSSGMAGVVEAKKADSAALAKVLEMASEKPRE